jgi:hypothetical protein
MKNVIHLAPLAGKDEQLTALTAAGFYGKTHLISVLLNIGANPMAIPKAPVDFIHTLHRFTMRHFQVHRIPQSC